MECFVLFCFLNQFSVTGTVRGAVQVTRLQIRKQNRGTERLLVFQEAENEALLVSK